MYDSSPLLIDSNLCIIALEKIVKVGELMDTAK